MTKNTGVIFPCHHLGFLLCNLFEYSMPPSLLWIFFLSFWLYLLNPQLCRALYFTSWCIFCCSLNSFPWILNIYSWNKHHIFLFSTSCGFAFVFNIPTRNLSWIVSVYPLILSIHPTSHPFICSTVSSFPLSGF